MRWMAVGAEASQVVGHLPGSDVLGCLSEEGRDQDAQGTVGEPVRKQPVDEQGLQERVHADVAKAQSEDASAVVADEGCGQVEERLGAADGVMAAFERRSQTYPRYRRATESSAAIGVTPKEPHPIDTASGLPTSVRRMTARRVAVTSVVLRPDLQPDEVDDGFGQALGHLVHELASVLARHFAQLRAEHDGGNECLQLLAWFQPE